MRGKPFSARIREHIRRNVVGYIALFCFVIGGTAVAVPSPSKQIKKLSKRINALDQRIAALEGEPDPAIPASLPPTGPAGGDLNGTFPNPQVQEAGLNSGGDLSGPLSAAQVSEAGLEAGGDLAGSTVAAAQIDVGVVGAPEIADVLQRVVLSASELGSASVGGAGQPDFGTQSGFPVILFDPDTDETLDVVVRAPDGVTSNLVDIRLFFTSTGSGPVRWAGVANAVTPDSAETLAAAPQLFTASGPATVTSGQVQDFGLAASSANFQSGDVVRVSFTRDANNAGDTLTADAAVLAVVVSFTTGR